MFRVPVIVRWWIPTTRSGLRSDQPGEEPTTLSKPYFHSGPVVTVRWSPGDDWHVEEISANVEEVLGRTPEEMLSLEGGYAGLVHPDDLESVTVAAEATLAHSNPPRRHYAYRVAHADGSWRHVLEHVSVVRDASGEPTGFTGYVIDVTAVRHNEQRLWEALEDLARTRRFLEETNEVARVGGWEVDLSSGGVRLTSVAAALHGLAVDETATLEGYLSTFLAGRDRERVRGLIDAAARTGAGFDEELRLQAGSDSSWVRFIGHLDATGPGHGRLYGVTQDIDRRKRSERDLRESEMRWQFALEGSGDGVWDWDVLTGDVRYSRRWKEMLGYEEEEIPNRFDAWLSLLHPEERDTVVAAARRYGERGEGTLVLEFRMRSRGGGWRWILSRGRVVEWSEDGAPVRIVGTHADITAQRDDQEARYRALVDQLHEVVFRTDSKLRWTLLNRAWERLTGLSVLRSLGGVLLDVVHPEDRDAVSALLDDVRDSDAPPDEDFEFRLVRGDGAERWVQLRAVRETQGSAQPAGLAGSLLDVTRRREQEEEVRRLALHDALTGLPNRRLLLDRLEHAIKRKGRQPGHGALLLLDLDDFKDVNDTRGHEAGDVLLIDVASRIRHACREEDTVARMGGDEFVVLVEDLPESEAAAAHRLELLSERLLDALRSGFAVDAGSPLRTSAAAHLPMAASIGIALFDGQAEAGTVLQQADVAMYRAKHDGRNRAQVFDPAMQTRIDERIAMAGALRAAIDGDRLHLAFQGQFDMDGRIIGAEALARWDDPALGAVSPARFIPLAEETGLIVPLGRRVLALGCAALESWQHDPRFRDIALSVNVSVREFERPEFVPETLELLEGFTFPLVRLQIELTESVFATDPDDLASAMRTLRGRGLRFSMDDFGTGYSSLRSLRQLPIHQLKIDQSFVRDIDNEVVDLPIIRTIIAMAHAMELEVIAEGVETELQAARLRELGCWGMQGWLMHRPSPRAEFEAFVHARGEDGGA
ncbi:MAG: EAL domain-containing protein [Deltaproteobacteria bacterium]|nr:MAG: EAL domain-containing protein [Deltaproteobacteria bacterium]